MDLLSAGLSDLIATFGPDDLGGLWGSAWHEVAAVDERGHHRVVGDQRYVLTPHQDQTYTFDIFEFITLKNEAANVSFF